jgi:hypothetical protein
MSHDSSVISRIAPGESDARHRVEIDAKARGTLARPALSRAPAIPKKTLRQRLRLPLLILGGD